MCGSTETNLAMAAKRGVGTGGGRREGMPDLLPYSLSLCNLVQLGCLITFSFSSVVSPAPRMLRWAGTPLTGRMGENELSGSERFLRE